MNRKLRKFLTSLNSAFFAAALLTVASPAQAGDVLFVSDTLTDAINIPIALSGNILEVPHPTIGGASFREAVSPDFHDVTIIRNDYVVTNPVQFAAEGTNLALAGLAPGVALADYCSIFWSASGPHEPDLFAGGVGADGGLHTDAAVFTLLDTYVAGGGYVFVTGHDAATDPVDPLMEAFVGGAGAIAVQQVRNPPNSGGFGTVSALNNALATGVVDLSGTTPGVAVPGGVNTIDGVSQDLDYIAGANAAEVTGVVAEPLGGTGAFMWTERVPAANGGAAAASNFEQGRIAYVANGIFLLEDLPFDGSNVLSDGQDVSWRFDPVYNGALRNFAGNACSAFVPDVVGLSQSAAEAAIVAADLTVGAVTTANSNSVPAGDVISQNPAAGTLAVPGSPVDLVVSLGPAFVTVPDVVSLSQAAAEAAIVSAGLTVGTVTTANSDTVPAGDVINQNPPAGTFVVPGSPVDLLVSLGPAPRMCDVDADGNVDITDIQAILAARNQPASGPDDPRDADGDGVITVLDARTCMAQCDLARCAIP
jgi:hypothetical protein